MVAVVGDTVDDYKKHKETNDERGDGHYSSSQKMPGCGG
jgi:hypothetical protein